MVNLILRMFGFGKAVDALDGETSKAYAGALVQILSGGATALGGLAGLASEFVAAHGASAYIALVQGLGHDANAGMVAAGSGLVGMGIAAIGHRHAQAKAQAEAAEQATAAQKAWAANDARVAASSEPKPDAAKP